MSDAHRSSSVPLITVKIDRSKVKPEANLVKAISDLVNQYSICGMIVGYPLEKEPLVTGNTLTGVQGVRCQHVLQFMEILEDSKEVHSIQLRLMHSPVQIALLFMG